MEISATFTSKRGDPNMKLPFVLRKVIDFSGRTIESDYINIKTTTLSPIE
jgi:hypothetical protein